MINRLYQLQERKGNKYIESFLDEDVVITEKIDTFRLIFSKKGDDIIFYKKDNTPITLVERVLSDVYEDAILEIPLITKDVLLPEGYFFGLYYTPVERPIRIPYSKLPKYILTDVTKRDDSNKIIESCDYGTVKEWAASLCMGRPPIIFEGKLSDLQKKTLLMYDTKQYDGEMSTFPEMIESIFGASYSQEQIIEGIVIKTAGNKISQVISYEFELLNEAYEKENESRDFYDIIISDLNEFLTTYNIPMLEAENKDALYVNIVCNIFNEYCKQRMVNESIDEKYLTPPQFGHAGILNKRLINNEETLEWIGKSPLYEALFKIFLSSFRKPKKPYGLLTEKIVESFNSYVSLINGYVNNFEQINLSEEAGDFDIHVELPSHKSTKYRLTKINEARSENIVVDAFKKRNPTDVDNMRVIASIQKAFEPRIKDVAKGLKRCAVYLTTFDPFTSSQMTNVTRISEMWKCPVIIFGISNEFKIKGKDFHSSDDLIKAQMTALSNDNKELIPGFGLLKSWNLTEIFEYCRPTYEPIVVITDKGKKSEMTLQLFFEEEIMGGRINVEDNFNVGELENEDKLSAFRAIEDNNYSLFMELTPSCIHNVMDNVFSEYRLWSGAIIKPIND